jgi:hypothetical protein
VSAVASRLLCGKEWLREGYRPLDHLNHNERGAGLEGEKPQEGGAEERHAELGSHSGPVSTRDLPSVVRYRREAEAA